MPEGPAARLWHAATLLREHRGGRHNAALLAHGIGGTEAHVLLALSLGIRAEEFKRIRHLPKAQLAAVVDGLRGRGLADAAGALTDAGRETRERTEALTDELAVPRAPAGFSRAAAIRRQGRERGMAFDQELAQRVRSVLAAAGQQPAEKKMFGGLSFLVGGNMCCGVLGAALLIRRRGRGRRPSAARYLPQPHRVCSPRASQLAVLLAGLGGNVRANTEVASTHSWSAGPCRPAGSTKTMPFIGRPVKSIGRTCGQSKVRSAPSGPSRTMRVSLTMPQNMWPPSRNASLPNSCRSVTASAASTAQTRSARSSS